MGGVNTGWRVAEHTADVAVELWGPSIEDVFAVGAIAVTSLLTEGASVDALAQRQLTTDGVDREALLVAWLNEVIYAAIVDGYVCAEVTVQVLDNRVVGWARGEAGAHDQIACELKSATYHQLRLDYDPPAKLWRAHVVIDV